MLASEHPPVRFRDGFTPKFLLTVDAEEDFDWGQPLARENVSVDSVIRLRKFQTFCENHGVRPCYLVDYPIANSSLAQDILAPAVAEGRADVGLQLHPWVTPPHSEEVTQENSFVGNLPRDLESAKLTSLANIVRKRFAADARIYRAGRYGFGQNTAALLIDRGIAIDSSMRAYHDYSASGGPDFGDIAPYPFWLDRTDHLLELPLTTMFDGRMRSRGPELYRRFARFRGLLARVGLLERIPLTPEGVTVDEAIRAIDLALEENVPILNFSFHSPSLLPGNTPYVRNNADLDTLYDWWKSVFAHLDAHGVGNVGVGDIIDAAMLE